LEMTHIKTANELIEKINAKPYGYYILDNDIDFTGIDDCVTNTFMGILDGNGHKILNNTNSIFQKIRYGYVRNLKFEGANIPKNITNIGFLAKQSQSSTIIDIDVKNSKINSAGRNDINLIAGATNTLVYDNCNVEHLVANVSNASEFVSKIQEDTSGEFNITGDIDFTDYTSTSNAVITDTFTGKINGNGHKISNLNNLSLFANFNGTFEDAIIENFSNSSTGRGSGNFVTAFAQETNKAVVKNVTFKNITLSGNHNVAVVAGMDGKTNATSVFENIKVLNSNVTGTGVYVSNFIGRKYGGSIKNVYVQGTLNITTTENGGLVGTIQQGGSGSYENIITDVNINKPRNTYSNVANSIFNGSLIGAIYTNPVIKNCVSFGDMTGYTDASNNEIVPYKCVGAAESLITACLTKCYEITESIGASRVTANTAGHLDTISRTNLNAEFYKDLGFSEEFWDFSTIATKGYPTLK